MSETDCDCAAACERAYDLGRYIAAMGEAKRCLSIYAHPDAMAKPTAAWALLPMGLGLAETLKLLADAPDEPTDDEVRRMWAYHHDLLAKRVSETQLAIEALRGKKNVRH